MRKSRFSESQVVAILKEDEAGIPIAEIVRKHGIRGVTFTGHYAETERSIIFDPRRAMGRAS